MECDYVTENTPKLNHVALQPEVMKSHENG